MTKKRPRRPFYQKNHKIILSNSRASQVEMTFTFDIKGTQVEVTPSADYTYVCGLCTKTQWNAYADANDAARDYIAIAKQYNMLESVVYTGKRTVDFTYLLEN